MKKIILFLFILTLNIACSKSKSEPGYEYSPEMVYSYAVEAFSESKLEPGKTSMLLPVKGTVSRNATPFLYGNTDAEKERAGNELFDPRPTTPERLAKGKHQYEIYCLVCHGKTGQGDGPVAAKYTEPPAFNGRALRDYKPGQMYHAIVLGFGDMPSHAVQLSENDRWDLILYLKELQKVE